ncbi:MAG: MBL fold metallo-hydrolase [candidate division Zixibacteria bacterium SM23_73_2]|nr:MAG: MBL fold metallo-hydrolase [candidate division Zixibacteria bacterium SM23_73_2]
MASQKLRPNIYWVGAVDWDRRLFDELIPLPDGTSYNSYFIKGSEKTALIDAVYPPKEGELLKHLKELDVERIDYVIANHAEQDHSGAIPRILELYPDAKVITNPKCKTMLMDLLLIPDEKFTTVEDNGTLSLGDKTLRFLYVPWVHWPETMFTYLEEEKILFTCDFLGSHLATSDFFVTDEAKTYEAAKRYYAEIMMPFRSFVRKNLEKIEDLDIELVAPSHGPVYDNPDFILDAYQDWASGEVKNEVVLLYVSMYGSTGKMVNFLLDALIKRGITVKPFNLTKTDIGELAMALVDTATIVIASPTVLGGPHPDVVHAAYLVNAFRPKARFAAIIGSYGWGGKMVDKIGELLSNLKAEMLEAVLVKGHPRKEDFRSLENLAEKIYNKHKEHRIIKS